MKRIRKGNLQRAKLAKKELSELKDRATYKRMKWIREAYIQRVEL